MITSKCADSADVAPTRVPIRPTIRQPLSVEDVRHPIPEEQLPKMISYRRIDTHKGTHTHRYIHANAQIADASVFAHTTGR